MNKRFVLTFDIIQLGLMHAYKCDIQILLENLASGCYAFVIYNDCWSAEFVILPRLCIVTISFLL